MEIVIRFINFSSAYQPFVALSYKLYLALLLILWTIGILAGSKSLAGTTSLSPNAAFANRKPPANNNKLQSSKPYINVAALFDYRSQLFTEAKLQKYSVIWAVGNNDNDNVLDGPDNDDDNDGIADIAESGGVDPTIDANGNGVIDYREVTPATDTNNDGINDLYDKDKDGIINAFDLDADNDGLPDAYEANKGFLPTGMAAAGQYTTTVVNSNDSDGDGFHNNVDASTGGIALANEDKDGDGLPNALDSDADNDGLPDATESTLSGSNLSNNDYDATNAGTFPVANKLPNFLDLDSDGDGMVDAIEANGGRLPANMNTNGQFSMATFQDADQDGLHSGVDPTEGGTVLINSNSDSDAYKDFLDIDSDNDGILDNREGQGNGASYIAMVTGTTALITDSDSDGLVDIYDPNCGCATPGIALTPHNYDADRDGLWGYRDTDADDDGIGDYIEGNDANKNGRPDYGDANNDNVMDPTTADTDADGLLDIFDSSSSRNNGINPASAYGVPQESDLDGIPDYRDADDDGDGLLTITEKSASPTLPYLIYTQGGFNRPDYLYDPVYMFEINNDAVQTSPNCFILTPGVGTKRGEAWRINPISLDKSFEINFSANFGNLDAGGADGIAFGFQRKAVDPVLAAGNTGEGIGFGHGAVQGGVRAGGISPSLAVEFDTHFNNVTGTLPNGTTGATDLTVDHIAIFTNGDERNVVAGPVQMSTTSGNTEDNLNHTIKIIWKKSVNTLFVYFDGKFRLQYQNDIVATIFGGDPTNIYFGYTASTGANHNTQSVCDIQFDPLDADRDGMADGEDIDDDNDGIPDLMELYGVNSGLDPLADDNQNGLVESEDNDGVPSYRDPKFTGKTWVDANADGVNDNFDKDQDGIINSLDYDADNDGITDVVEANNGLVPAADYDANRGILTSAVGTNGMPNTAETSPDNGVMKYTLADFDGDGILDYLDIDADNDGLLDNREAQGNIIIAKSGLDSDKDGLDDAYDRNNRFSNTLLASAQVLTPVNSDRSGSYDYRDVDADDDGLLDNLEAQGVTVRLKSGADADQDGLDNTYDPTCGCPTAGIALNPVNTDKDAALDYLDLDSDNDGILDIVETQSNYFVKKANLDTDGDGLDDSYDPICGCSRNGVASTQINSDATALPANQDGLPDYLDPDSDGDLQLDVAEGNDINDNGISLDDFKLLAATFGGNNLWYADTDADGNKVPDWLDNSNNDLFLNFLDVTSSFYQDTDQDGLVDIYDPDNLGTVPHASNDANNYTFNYSFRNLNEITPLPVEIINFAAIPGANFIKLSWQTASEHNNDYFQVERSSEGIHFTAISKVKGAGTTDLLTSYQFLDKSPSLGTNYYRLKQMDLDQSFRWSAIVSARINQTLSERDNLVISPNPFEDLLQIMVEATREDKLLIKINNLLGKTYWVSEIPVLPGLNNIMLPLGSLNSGLYLIELKLGEKSTTQRIIKR
ncbi:hypothetical protein AHMF7605_28795 [Adhaeribacter arboris]|uniref:Secretion system C-terminal sorting domain-containing protein n=1 Tax=Adhaeribacter arboris TaxID=2072846 RepID=A0A2T2Y8R6_9BACT|nr:T9SS type A sorting domain-containing protein [Adhaeribacter arboris]PSR51910.1 hypothetical protein AHMF7605_28795 [Adhaeribacter arboris]